MNAKTKTLVRVDETTTRKAEQPSKPSRPAQRPARSSRAAAKSEKLVCRYCGSDDLAPSFKKRRDARCRACFKKRYASASPRKRAAKPQKAKANK